MEAAGDAPRPVPPEAPAVTDRPETRPIRWIRLPMRGTDLASLVQALAYPILGIIVVLGISCTNLSEFTGWGVTLKTQIKEQGDLISQIGKPKLFAFGYYADPKEMPWAISPPVLKPTKNVFDRIIPNVIPFNKIVEGENLVSDSSGDWKFRADADGIYMIQTTILCGNVQTLPTHIKMYVHVFNGLNGVSRILIDSRPLPKADWLIQNPGGDDNHKGMFQSVPTLSGNVMIPLRKNEQVQIVVGYYAKEDNEERFLKLEDSYGRNDINTWISIYQMSATTR